MSIHSDVVNYLRWIDEGWYDGREADIVGEIFAKDYVGHIPGRDLRFEDLVPWVTSMRKAFPDAHFVIKDTIEADPKAVIMYSFSGTQRGEYLARPPSGRRFEVGGLSLLLFKHGKLIEEWIQWDALGHFTQLGILPSVG